jgi:HEAT repeat protein
MTKRMAKGPTRKKPLGAATFQAQLEADPEYQARKRLFDAERAADDEACQKAEEPLVEALKAAGFGVSSVWDFVNTTESYTAALPILLEHLQQNYPDKVREGIARAMAVPESRFAWQPLLSLFRRDFDQNPNGVKWAIGCALGAAADDEVVSDLVELFRDTRHGVNRLAFIDGLARSRSANARAALEAGRADPQLTKEISRVLDRPLKRRKSRQSRDNRCSLT